MSKRLVLCVDDFGLKPEVNEAVAELADLGLVSATGCMSQAPWWAEGAAVLRGARRERLDVGLHLNLTEPFEGVAGPSQARWALPLPRLIGMALLRALDPQTLHRAVCTQLDAFEDVWGAAPDFVDGHQHVHQLPQVREVLLAELRRRYGSSDEASASTTAQLPWLRLTTARRGPAGIDGKQRVIEWLGARSFERMARAAGFRLNGALLGVYGFDAEAGDYARRLRQWLAQAQTGDVLMMHPARPCHEVSGAAGLIPPGGEGKRLPNGGGHSADPIWRARETEYTVLREHGRVLMTQEGVQGVRMSDCSSILVE